MIEIGAMTAADIEEVAAIEQQSVSPWSVSQLAEEMENQNALILVARKLGEIVGWCTVRTIWPETELLKIAVAGGARKRGVATALLTEIIAKLVHTRFKSLFIEVRSNNRSALKLYKKYGFSHIDTRGAYYHSPADDALILMKQLTGNNQ